MSMMENGVITELDSTRTQADTVLEADGLVLAPGLVDMHVHLRDPGLTYKEDILTGCEAAAPGRIHLGGMHAQHQSPH